MTSAPKDNMLRSHVAAAVATSWPEFARSHPALARVIDEAILREHVARSLDDDAAFQEAFQAASDARLGHAAIASLVETFVAPVLRRLL